MFKPPMRTTLVRTLVAFAMIVWATWLGVATSSSAPASSWGCGGSGRGAVSSASSTARSAAESDHDRVYLWAADPFALLDRAFQLVGYTPANAIDAAMRVMANTDPLAINEPREFLEYAFSAAGFSDETANELADQAIARFTEDYGFMLPVTRVGETPPPGRSLNTRAFFRWQSDVYGFVMASLQRLGYEPQAASTCTEIALRMMDLFDPNSERHRQSDWRAGGPYPVLHEALRSLGFDPVEADLRTRMVFAELGIPGWLPRPTMEEEQCEVYSAQIYWCVGTTRYSRAVYFIKDDWDAILAAKPITSTCPLGQDWWWEFTRSTTKCLGNDPGPGVCIYLGAIAGPQQVSCSLSNILTLQCFVETSPTINASAIDRLCAHAQQGPSGDKRCPDCQPNED